MNKIIKQFKLPLYLFIIISFSLLLFPGCTKPGYPEKELIIIDSLGWQESDDYAFVFPFELKASDEELFVVDNGASQVFVFDEHTFEYKRTIGEKGKGPGELMSPQSIGITDTDSLIILDTGNYRLQYFERSGVFARSVPEFGLWTISQDKTDIYADIISLLPETGIYKIEPDTLRLLFSLSDWLQEHGLKSIEENFYTFGVLENNFVISFIFNPRILLINQENGILNTVFNIPDRGFSNQQLGKPLSYKRGFLLPVTNFSEGSESQTRRTELIHYRLDSSIVETFIMPGNKSYFLEGLLLEKNYIYAIDSLAGILYKYIIPQ